MPRNSKKNAHIYKYARVPIYNNTFLTLVSRTQQVVDCLHRIKCFNRHFHKYCVPVTHRAIPQTRKFQSLDFMAGFRFFRNKACVLIHIFRQIKFLTLIILDIACLLYTSPSPRDCS